MRFYRQVKQAKLHSFGEDIGESPILRQSLSDLQREYVLAVGGTLVDIKSIHEIKYKGNYFVFKEDLFFTLPFLKASVKLAKTENKNIQFCVESNTFNQRYILPTLIDTDEYHVYQFQFYNGNAPVELGVINQKIYEASVDFPEQIVKNKTFSMDQCDTFASHIISPFHLLQVNIAMNLLRTVKFQSRIPEILRKKFGHLNSRWFYRGLKRLNKIGKNCNIHHTALIEGSVIGDNVTIGAYSVIRVSNVSSNCSIAENVTVINSVLGTGTFIANSNFIGNCLTYNEVFLIHGPYHASIFGENSACFAVINCDIRLDQETIKIPTSQGILDSNQPLLGIAYGHRSKTGGGNIIAAGRIVPNDLHITPPDNIILNFNTL